MANCSATEEATLSTGTIIKLIRLASPCPPGEVTADDGYGIIRGHDGHDVYFVNSAVKGCRFDELASGLEVRYAVEEGPLGRAASVYPVTSDKPN
jgi:cold shock CspA family protein